MVEESPTGGTLATVYQAMLTRYGPQKWWPGDSPFEMMVGAVLTQAASWTNVEMAIANLRKAEALAPVAMREMDLEELAQLVYPSGYYNAKARKLKALANFIGTNFGDDIDAMASADTALLREQLLEVHGIGDETADAILLYPLDRPAFVVDTYARRLLFRLRLAPESERYSFYRSIFTDHLPEDTEMFSEFHALIVRHGRETCKKTPVCAGCCLLEFCPTGQAAAANEDEDRR